VSDITTVWVPALGRGDWVLKGADLQNGGDLTSAVLISLFTDRVANTDDVITDASGDPRGWWGDVGVPYPIGSRLWLLEREKQTNATAARARDYIAEALKWMIDDGVVARFEIDAQFIAPARLAASVIAHRADGATIAMNFANVWLGIK
jgi:phage gp46-like protein